MEPEGSESNLPQSPDQSGSQTPTPARFTSAKFVSAIPLLNINQKKRKAYK